MTFIPRKTILLVTLLLASCASPNPSNVQVTMMGTKGVGRANEVVARAGDSVEKLARNANLNIEDLLSMNGLIGAGNLSPGQMLKTPLPSEITVIEGDSVDTIARALGIDRTQLVSLNNLQYPYVLIRGQVLKVPSNGYTSNDTSPTYLPTVSNNAVTQQDLAPVTSGPISTTQSGTGKTIHTSGSGVITEEELAPPPNAKSAEPVLPPLQQPLQTASIGQPVKPEIVQPKTNTSPLPTTPPQFSWPVNGSVVSDYGPKADGQKNEGIDIGAPQGTSVRSAAMGDVVYVGDNVAGFGNLILLRHGGGYATAYGHVQNPLVKRGDRVMAGQAIAQIGKTGNATTPRLHFEVRKGTTAVNPNSYLN
jgi:murein DD-endopeptidase MepM/ murein hydrolase activator NlpD